MKVSTTFLLIVLSFLSFLFDCFAHDVNNLSHEHNTTTISCSEALENKRPAESYRPAIGDLTWENGIRPSSRLWDNLYHSPPMHEPHPPQALHS